MNSQEILPGDVFVCVPGIPGFLADRHDYAIDAVKRGAVALVVERELDISVPSVIVPDARFVMALFASHFYGYPSHNLKLIGVTGTNGKTTTCHMIEAIIAHAGFRTGLMGNFGTKIGSNVTATTLNTQEPPNLQQNLRKMLDVKCEYSIMEVTSQGLHLGRVRGCRFRTAVLTNVTQDHLDYHGSMDNYRTSKGLLFSRMGNTFSPDFDDHQFVVLNADDDSSLAYRRLTNALVLTYGITNSADVMAQNIQSTAYGTSFQVLSFAGTVDIHTRMIGIFNIYNALAAITAALAEHIPLNTIQEALRRFEGVPGRMEVVDEGQDYLVLADYAHTPDGLDNVLATIKDLANSRVILVFGCGGDRDRSKRSVMGEIAANYCDYIILTSDNPRSENPEHILADIEEGLTLSGMTTDRYTKITDRKEAITRAIAMAEPSDVVLLAGKGHETEQILNNCTIHFDDREEARNAIRKQIKDKRIDAE